MYPYHAESRNTIHHRFKGNGLYPAKRGLEVEPQAMASTSNRGGCPDKLHYLTYLTLGTYLTSLTYHTIPYLTFSSLAVTTDSNISCRTSTRDRARLVVARAPQRERHTCMA